MATDFVIMTFIKRTDIKYDCDSGAERAPETEGV